MHPSACEQGPGNQKIPLELLIPSFKEAAAAQAGGLGVCRKEGPGSTSGFVRALPPLARRRGSH